MKIYEPSNIDLLNIGNGCNLNCSQCFYQEIGKHTKRDELEDIETAMRLMRRFPTSSFFVYPKEITTSTGILPLMSKVGQKKVLSNGIELDAQKIADLKSNGIERIKITMFSNYEEYRYFNLVSEERYKGILEKIKLCKQHNLFVTVNTILTKTTKNSIKKLAVLCSELNVDKIEFLRLKPIGNAQDIDRKEWIDEDDMVEIVTTVEECKIKYPNIYFSFSISFGVSLYGKTEDEAREKIRKAGKSGDKWTKSNFLCPAIDRNYFGISLRTGKIYGCFFSMDQDDFLLGKINLGSGEVIEMKPDFLNSEYLRENLQGNCHRDNCKYQHLCLGGCRSTAHIFAKYRGDKNPMYAGMDICITKVQEKIGV